MKLEWMKDFALKMKQGDLGVLSKAITLMESTRADDQAAKLNLLDLAWPYQNEAVVIGITGAPGVGKSTFINKFGLLLLQDSNVKVAVLSIDPSSSLTGGSILGDKTRMTELSQHNRCYVRPSSSQSSLGGVNPSTMESILLLKSFGFDYILIESVGVGQSESELHDMCDDFWPLIAPGQGDDLQSLKRGVLEMADAMIINKCDHAFQVQSHQTYLDYQLSAHLNQGGKNLEVFSLSVEGMKDFEKFLQNKITRWNSPEGMEHKRIKRAEQYKKWIKKVAYFKITEWLTNRLDQWDPNEAGKEIPHRIAYRFINENLRAGI